jgi:hypothetical protein
VESVAKPQDPHFQSDDMRRSHSEGSALQTFLGEVRQRRNGQPLELSESPNPQGRILFQPELDTPEFCLSQCSP